MKTTLFKKLIFPITVIVFVIVLLMLPVDYKNIGVDTNQNTLKAEITEVKDLEIINQTSVVQEIQTKILSGDEELENKIISLINDEKYEFSPREFKVGDKVMIIHTIGETDYFIADYIRTPVLTWLFILFVVVVLLVAGLQGLGALVGLFITFLVLFKIILPLIIQGFPPVWAAILGAIIIIPSTFYCSHGVNRKTNTAILSTLISLIIAGLLADLFASWGNLTGLASSEVGFLQPETAQKIDFRGLLLAGMIISILGVMDDITIAQASVVNEIKNIKQKISKVKLFSHAMKVGHDHISSMVNTLILVYTGAALPLLLLFLDKSQEFFTIINNEFMAEEIIRTLVGSIGLVLAVPITTFLAIFMIKSKKTN